MIPPVPDLVAGCSSTVSSSTTSKCKYISFAYVIAHSPEWVTSVIKAKDSGY